ncbi:MAG: chemotaxis-specific protein-glutamate methyltransferase CheB [Lachnospiraceae bacterium]|nr:chemotaxis-specific protein-glutamate methyltransferase CheB [Lachnospiraceae bacterium]
MDDKNFKKILVVDDSALMRRVLCDIIDSDKRFQVVDKATNGYEAFDLLSRNKYDAVVLDVNMPKMNGLQLLEELRKYKIQAKVMMASTDTSEGAKTTLDALELGALDFIHKPINAIDCRNDEFVTSFLETLSAVADSAPQSFVSKQKRLENQVSTVKVMDLAKKHAAVIPGKKAIAIASSTGGPKALMALIPMIPKEIDAPIVIVQHMPKGFTQTLAERLDGMSKVSVKEAGEGDVLEKGHVYIARGGSHLNIVKNQRGQEVIKYSDEPMREGVKPCSNYMYESLADSEYDNILCVVLTGMGADGTVGIGNLKKSKKVRVLAQDEESCTVFGMPKSIIKSGYADQIVSLDNMAQEIVLNVGLNS